MNRVRPVRLNLVLAGVVLALLLSGCAGLTVPTPSTEPTEAAVRRPIRSAPVPAVATPSTGLQFRLQEGSEQPSAAEVMPATTAQPLAEADTNAVLTRVAPLPARPEDAQAFAFPPTPMAAPRPGQTVNLPFPPPTAPAPPVEAGQGGPLAVLRYAPEGDVPLAANLSVTFDRPMVALTSLADLAAQTVPVKLSPQPAGKWRWVGAKTLVFEPQATETTGTARLPMATTYTAEIPAGIAAASGVTLTRPVTWTFTTPPPQIVTSYPGGDSQPLDPLIFIAFDQQIVPAAVTETIKVEIGRAAVPIRLATDDEVQADSAVAELAKNAGKGRWLAFRPLKPLPPAAGISVKVGPGTPSAEGPLTTQGEQSFSFTTYGPLTVRESRCGWGQECPPLSSWFIEFSNPLDEAVFASEQITVTPELPGLNTNVFGNTLMIQGNSRGRTTYTVRLSGDIRDTFGQTLGQDQTVTFKVTSAQPTLWGPGDSLVTLDPSAKAPAYSAFTINYDRLIVTGYAVAPADWTAFQKYLRESWRTDQPPALPGRKVISQTITVQAKPDEMAETVIDLSEALRNNLGHVVLVVQPDAVPAKGEQLPKIVKWIQATRIGLDAAVDNENLLAWANSLADGKPLAGVTLALLPGSRAATTDAAGMATLALPFSGQAQLLTAAQGDDTALLPASPFFWNEAGWAQQPRRDALRWYVFDDRGLYRPGEEVHVKGWIRAWGAGPRGDISLAANAADQIGYRLSDSRGNRLLDGTAKVNALGGFDLALKLPEGMNLGDAPLELTATGSGAFDSRQIVLTIQVQEFRRPEFEVKATTVSAGPFFVGDSADLEVKASYYAGGALPNAETTWRVTARSGSYSPPGWDDFTFGRWVPWWRMWEGAAGPEREETFAGRTDAGGVHRLHLDFTAVNPPEPSVVTAEATVMDVNRQAWTSTATLLVHPADLYVGLRSQRLFVQKGEPLKVDAIVTDLDGKAIGGRDVTVKAVRLAWRYKNGAWQQEESDAQTCIVRSAVDPVQCKFDTATGGTYQVTATVLDDRERANRSELTLWVAGGERPPEREVKQEEVTLIPNGKSYQPGDVAEILVQTPFYPAEGLLTLRRSGMVNSERFTMDGPTTTLRVKIEDAYIPNIHVQVDLVGAATRSDDKGEPLPDAAKRPAYATGEINLPVPPLARTLKLEAVPRDEKLEPGGKTAVTVTVRDAAGQPVSGAEVAVVVVDEAILALTSYDPADPVSVFYEERSPDVSDSHSRSSILLVNPADLQQATAQAEGRGGGAARAMATQAPAALAAPAPMAAADAKAVGGRESAAPAIAVRSDFNPLATFVPAAATDGQGNAVVEVKLPDNLTRYRVIAVAVAGGKQFGKAESAITARLPLMVRPSPPRFLNFGDRFELPVVVQNQTDVTMTVDVAVRAANAALTAGSGRRVIVPPNDRVEVRFPVTTVSAGIARFQVGAVQQPGPSARPPASDAAQFELPVWTPATTEAFAVYGEVDSGSVAQPVIAPSGVYTQFGGLEISTSSTALQALTDAVLYLTAYPFECTEQMASRVLAVAALRDVLTAFQAEGLPTNTEIEASVARDIAQLRALQNDDGGWSVWRRGDESWPFHSIHVANALQRAKAKGYDVTPDTLERAGNYLRTIEQRYPAWYPQDIKWTLTAYALNVRAQMGDRDAARARSLIKEAGLEKLSLEAVGWLLPVLSGDAQSEAEVTAIRRLLLNRATETAGAAHFVTSYGDNGYLLLHSDRRADGILLDALIGDQPKSDLIPKIVRGLLAQRKAGHWMNTQENVFILLALDRYFNTYETQTPDFVARIWLGDQYAGEATFKGRTTGYQEIAIPMKQIATLDGEQNLVLSKDGPGRLYYRLGLRYAPTDLNLPPYDAGFTVERIYQAVDKPGDVTRDADGTWRIKAGARVRVSLTLVAPTRRYHVALVDPLPAGLEALNPALAVTGSVPPAPQTTAPTPQSRWYWWWRPWYEHDNLRDERVEAFASLLWDGVWSYSYVARATTPGTFVVPPAKAEEMYMPETFGRSGVDRVVVE